MLTTVCTDGPLAPASSRLETAATSDRRRAQDSDVQPGPGDARADDRRGPFRGDEIHARVRAAGRVAGDGDQPDDLAIGERRRHDHAVDPGLVEVLQRFGIDAVVHAVLRDERLEHAAPAGDRLQHAAALHRHRELAHRRG